MNDSQTSSPVAARVRANFVPAVIAAVLLILFGFLYLAKPTGTDLYSRSAQVFYHTLRIGGVAMALIAMWSLTGRRHALLADAVASLVIGLLFILSGGGMIVDGGGVFPSSLNILFGLMFMSAGLHNGRAFAAFASPGRHEDLSDAPFARSTGRVADEPTAEVEDLVKPGSRIDRLREARTEAIRTMNYPSSEVQERPIESPSASPSCEPAAEGFLASFADDRPPRSP